MKKILIFGATSGIGKMLAEKFVSDGAYVIATGRRFPLLEALRETAPDRIEIYQNDVVQIEETEKLFHQLIAKHGRLDMVIHCSGIGVENPVLDWSVEAETLKTNVWAATHIYGLVFKQFQKQEFGHLVAISSIASLRGNRHAPAYFASKAFQVNYLESLYFKTKEIKTGKVYVTDIRPGFVDTKMALGNEIFWLTPLPKAVRQIYSAIAQKKRKVYISHRWSLIAFVLKIVPSWLIKWVK